MDSIEYSSHNGRHWHIWENIWSQYLHIKRKDSMHRTKIGGELSHQYSTVIKG